MRNRENMRIEDEILLAAFNNTDQRYTDMLTNVRVDRFVYVAGKFRGQDRWEVESNIRVAEDWSMALWKLGVPNICPHTIGRHLDGMVPDSFVLPVMVNLMLKCDAVLVMPGWESSVGTRAEMEQAHNHQIPIFESTHGVNAFIHNNDARSALPWRTEYGPTFVENHKKLREARKMQNFALVYGASPEALLKHISNNAFQKSKPTPQSGQVPGSSPRKSKRSKR